MAPGPAQRRGGSVEDVLGWLHVGAEYTSKKVPPGDINNSKGVMPGIAVGREVPNTGGPPLIVGAPVFLGAALIVRRGVLRR